MFRAQCHGKSMNRCLWIGIAACALATLACTPVLAAPALELVVPDNAEYGRPIHVQLIARGLDSSLREYRPAALSALFEVDSVRFEDDDNNREQTLALTVYARQAGRVEIPALVFQDLSTAPATVTVTEAVDRKTGEPMTVRFDALPDRAWLRQAIAVRVAIEAPDAFLVLDLPAPQEAAWQIEAIAPVTARLDPGRYAHRGGWYVFALRAGQQELNLPAVQVVRDGVVTHRFFPPPLVPRVEALPPYLPTTVPVGSVALEVSAPTGWWLREDTLQSLRLTVTGDGTLPQMLPPVARQLQSNADIVFYPAKARYSKKVTPETLRSSAEIEVPFRTLVNGRVDVPDLRIQWFDPASGQLRSATTQMRLPLSLGMPWLTAIAVVLAGIGTSAVYWVAAWLKRALVNVQRYRRALATLSQANTPGALRNALKHVAEAEGWQHNLTLQAWYHNWSERYGCQRELESSVGRLERALYSDQPDQADATAAATFWRSVRRAHPLLSLFAAGGHS